MKEQEVRDNENDEEIEENRLNPQNQHYADSLHQSKFSMISHASNPKALLHYFQSYVPKAENIQLSELQSSKFIKLKKYKEAVYYGEFINNRRHGKGIMIYDNGRVYEGSWENDFKHGTGYEKFPNQCVYKGQYINGKPEGQGRYEWPNQQFYEGQWVNGLKHGYGMWKGTNEDSYIGEWKFGKPDGFGVFILENGDRYQGEFRNSLKCGQGIQKFISGDIYKGLYQNGKFCGYGEYYWANGSYFKGLYRNGKRNGNGIWKRNSGNSDKYEGEYKNDRKDGYGIFTWANGNTYKGHYKDDFRNGYGEIYWNDGSFYRGQWLKGIQHGEGQLYIPSQGLKQGIFENNVLIMLKSNQSETNPQQALSSHHSKKLSMDSRSNFRSRGVSFASGKKKRPQQKKQMKPIKERNVIRYNGKSREKQLQNHPYIPRKFERNAEPKNLVANRKAFQPKQTIKQRAFHSSFFIHKINRRGTISVQDRRPTANNTENLHTIQVGNKDRGDRFNNFHKQ